MDERKPTVLAHFDFARGHRMPPNVCSTLTWPEKTLTPPT